ncbi:hypothetical protein PAP_10280 [Palaeococcus pacificus DY20341]|uniref:RCK N-terminal domain-containing protein n=1 Tax=Palaeococcus pacificus DY20341 TaxID=1343739 RepID=A0A075LWJ7_9EURY|nr:ion channel [Palaeococcus pacificus]AIF70427.1 hypothetical protein PAP_10280 [Palaeococcus pacificus DY20341]
MIPVPLVRKLIRVGVKVKKNKLITIAIVVLLLALSFSALFMYFEGLDMFSAIYWAIITMSTIGYGDVTPQTYGGRIVAMVAAIAGISTFTALISLLAESFISSSIRRMMGMHKVDFKDHYVVIGKGESILSCVNEIMLAISNGYADNKPVVVLLPSEEEKKRLELSPDVEILIGEPSNKDTLKRANVESAKYVILALEDDSKSVFVTLLVKGMSNAKVFVEALRPESFELLKQAGADRVIVSRELGGRLLASSIFEPEVVDVIEDLTTSTGSYDITVIPGDEVWGLEYKQAFEKLYPKGCFLMGYIAQRVVLMPSLAERIPKGSKLVVLKRAGK